MQKKKKSSEIVQLADSEDLTDPYFILDFIVSCFGKPYKMYQKVFW